VTATFKHFESHYMPPMPLISVMGLTVAPPVQAIVVDSVPTVNPQLTSVIGDNAESVTAGPEDACDA
jgi:hypothetical protein